MSASDVLSELEAIGAVGNADVQFEEPVPESAKAVAPAATVIARPSIDERKIEELVGFCDKLLQVFGILARANTELTRTAEEMREMIAEFRSTSYEEDEDTGEQIAYPELKVEAQVAEASPGSPPSTSIEESEPIEIPIDVSGFDIPPNIPLPAELNAEPSFPPPLARAPILPSSNMQPDRMDQALVEAAMREMGLRG